MNKKTGETLRLVLVRHAETTENSSKIVQGQGGGSLNETGRRQAVEIARRLADEKPDFIYSSDLQRGIETAEIIVREIGNLSIHTDSRLREQDYGIFEGRRVARLLGRMKSDGAGFTDFDAEGGERAEDFRKRAASFLEEIKARHFGQTVAVVTHNGVILVMLDLLHGDGEKMPQKTIVNGAVIALDVGRSGRLIPETVEGVERGTVYE